LYKFVMKGGSEIHKKLYLIYYFAVYYKLGVMLFYALCINK
jgi:hypothetical protein